MQKLKKLRLDTDTPPGSSRPEIRRSLANRNWNKLANTLQIPTRDLELKPDAFASWGLPPATKRLKKLRILAREPEFCLFLAEANLPYSQIRSIILRQFRKHPDTISLWWWYHPGNNELKMLMPEKTGNDRLSIRHFSTPTTTPSDKQVDKIEKLSLQQFSSEDLSDPLEGLRRHFRNGIKRSDLTDTFFRKLRKELNNLCQSMQRGPSSEKSRRAIALDTLLRLLFTYYLQSHGLLDGDKRYVVRKLRESRKNGDNFYRECLHPLFFGALNTRKKNRYPEAKKLGDIPFLNGGLFEPSEYERNNPHFSWPNRAWNHLIEQLLEQHHFIAKRQDSRDKSASIDPEMLGKVFERLMYEDERKNSGSFYTPNSLVKKIVRDSLISHISKETGLRAGAIRQSIYSAPSSDSLPGLADSIRNLKMVDPAVGTGAFLVTALHEIRHLYRISGLEKSTKSEAQIRTDIIHRHLYGVDTQRNAVRICELRLWLAVFSGTIEEDPHKTEPLPNLGHRIETGDSLLYPWAALHRSEHNSKKQEKLTKLQRDYVRARGSDKYQLEREIDRLQKQIEKNKLDSRIESLKKRLSALKQGQQDQNLFGIPKNNSELKGKKDKLKRKIELIRQRKQNLHKQDATGFAFETYFGLDPNRDGFDIVMTNPPWVRSRRIDSDYRERLKKQYNSFDANLWPSASETDIQYHFGPQINLSSIFIERCLELLKSNGTLSVLFPARTLRSMHDTEVRRFLGHQNIEVLEDYSECDRDYFEADVYPARMTLRKVKDIATITASTNTLPLFRKLPPNGNDVNENERPSDIAPQKADTILREPSVDLHPTNRSTLDRPATIYIHRNNETKRVDNTTGELLACGDDPGEPWMLASPRLTDIFQTMRKNSVPLGTIDAVTPRKGVMTGRNNVFIAQKQTFRKQLSERIIEEWSRPVISGRSIKSDHVSIEKRILWAYDSNLEIAEELPNELEAYFESHSETLQARSDYDPSKPLWQLYRLRAGITSPKIVWRDLSPTFNPILVSRRAIALNSTYYIAVDDRQKAKLIGKILRSPPVTAFAKALAQRARGGWRRHFAWTVKMLPIPEKFARLLRCSPIENGQKTYYRQICDSFGLSDRQRHRLKLIVSTE